MNERWPFKVECWPSFLNHSYQNKSRQKICRIALQRKALNFTNIPVEIGLVWAISGNAQISTSKKSPRTATIWVAEIRKFKFPSKLSVQIKSTFKWWKNVVLLFLDLYIDWYTRHRICVRAIYNFFTTQILAGFCPRNLSIAWNRLNFMDFDRVFRKL